MGSPGGPRCAGRLCWAATEKNSPPLSLHSVTRFSGVHTLDLHFPGTATGSPARIDFIGFKGTWQPAKREAVVAVYESAPQAADHKVSKSELSCV